MPVWIQWRANAWPARLGLRALVLVVREHEVVAAAVEVEALAEELERHRRALDVPARPALAPRRVPRRLARLGRLPQREVDRAALRLVDLDPRAGRLAQLARACGAAARRTPGNVSTSKYTPWPSTTYACPRSTSSPISSSIAVDVLGGVRDVVGVAHAEPVHLRRSTRPRTRAASSGSVRPSLGGAGDDLVLDVGDVAHVRDVEPGPLEVAADRCRTRPPCGRGRCAATS